MSTSQRKSLVVSEEYNSSIEAAGAIILRQDLLRLQGLEMNSASIVKTGGKYLMTIEGVHSEVLKHFKG